jgi:sporulation protein YlmC with PRC-barrel domain
MRRITRCSIPAAVAFFMVAAHPQSTNNDAKASPPKQHLDAQQKNEQSTFDPHRVSDSDLRKSVTDLNKASTFIGMPVQNLQNDKLGSVKDLVFDPSSGKISYAVLSVGGFLGVGDKLIAVPITSVRPQPGQKSLVVDMTTDQIKNAPGLARNNWPDLDDPAFGAPASSEKASSSGSSKDSTVKNPSPEAATPSAPASPSTSKDQGGSPTSTSESSSSNDQKSSDKAQDSQSKNDSSNPADSGKDSSKKD